MRFPKLVLAAAVATLLVAPARGQGQGGGPDSAQAAQMAAQQAQMRAMMEQIARQRPVQAESVARKMLLVLQAAGVQQRLLDALKARSQDQYWQEVAQLTVQQQILRQMQDSMRQQLMTQMFGAEALARALQRDYRRMIDSLAGKGQPLIVVDGVPISGGVPIQGQPPVVVVAPITQPADSARVRAIREQLRVVLERHFAAEDSLRALEIADVERRLAQVRAETLRRRRDRAELVRQMVEEVLRDAKGPE
ncbi:MAG TPA: hypothetical protein VEK86_11700 [Gemmatimonadales bacterium]|nr:hypothetical protein [Gemmatimonadales bacterium]